MTIFVTGFNPGSDPAHPSSDPSCQLSGVNPAPGLSFRIDLRIIRVIRSPGLVALGSIPYFIPGVHGIAPSGIARIGVFCRGSAGLIVLDLLLVTLFLLETSPPPGASFPCSKRGYEGCRLQMDVRTECYRTVCREVDRCMVSWWYLEPDMNCMGSGRSYGLMIDVVVAIH